MPVQPILPAVLDNFENNAPGDSYIKILYLPNTGDVPLTYTVHAVNINTTACFNVSVFDAVADLTYISFTIGNDVVTAQVLTKVNKGNYWHFRVTPFLITAINEETGCTLTLFEPSIISTTFQYSDFNALLSNASTSRTSDFIYDVDRVRSQSIPTNLAAILSNTALKAPIQDSSYSSIGLTNSRYGGAKTNILTYGFAAAINASIVEAGVYNKDKSLASICSQSLSDKPIKDYLFSIESSYDTDITNAMIIDSGSYVKEDPIDVPQIRYKRVYAGSIPDQYISVGGFSEHLFLNGDVSADILPNRYYVARKRGNVNYGIEYIKLTNPLYYPAQAKTRYDVEHEALSFLSVTGVINSTIVANTGHLHLYEMVGDTIYNTEGSQVYKITEKLIFVADSEKIYYIDDKGQVLYELSDCST
jgi:hypothetical protein